MITLSKSNGNTEGQQVRVIVSSKIVSEGVDFRFVRQIHILDPWWNMSRIEQVAGRGLRNCSHQALPFDDQNCTVYFHVARTGDGKECFDEYTYRTKVEQKALKIARVRKVMAESAMDCPLQNAINTLPEDWKMLPVPQRQSEGGTLVSFRLADMLAPAFTDTPDVAACTSPPPVPDPTHVRPLSTYLDVRDELLGRLAELLIAKPIWDRADLLTALRPYTAEVSIFNIQQAIRTGYRFKDSFGRPSLLESKGDLVALAPIGVPNGTMIERISQPPIHSRVDLPAVVPRVVAPAVAVADDLMERKLAAYTFPADARTRFSADILSGFILDHEFTDDEKRAYLRNRPAIPSVASRVIVEVGAEGVLVVMGKGAYEPPEIPIGAARTAVTAWNAALLTKFLEAKETVFASLNKDTKLTVSKMTIEGDRVVRKLDKANKKFEPVVCDTGANTSSVMNAFAKAIDVKGVGLAVVPGKREEDPPKILTGPSRCIYLELLAREEHGCIWLTPEELSVLYDGKGAKGRPPTNQDVFTEAFRK